jgi:hypothetical protein
MKRYVFIFGFGLIVLLLVPFRAKSRVPTAIKSDLSIILVGFTNNPTSPPLSIAGSGKGLHALFAVTNTSTREFIRFDTVAVEWLDGGAWKEFGPLLEGWPTNLWRGISGSRWSPGHGGVQAVAWPGISTNSSWRLRVSVSTDPTLFKQAVNEKVRQEIFYPHDTMMITGPEVRFDNTN